MPKKIYVGAGNYASRVRKIYVGIGSAKNLLVNGSLYSSTDGWTIQPSYYNVVFSGVGYLTIMGATTSPSGTYPCYQFFSPISGNTEDKRQVIYVCAKVRGRRTNISYPRVYLRYYADGSTEESFENLSSVDGLSGTDLNDDFWHTVSARVVTYNASLERYFDYDRIGFGINITTEGDHMDIKEIYMCNLTTTYGRGNEPSKEWCDANLTNYAEEIQTGTELSVARRIKKAYIGIGGKARPCFGGILEYYGQITPLSVARSELAATTVGSYALFGGGSPSYNQYSSIVDSYNTTLTRQTINMSVSKVKLAATALSNYALFGGGSPNSNVNVAVVDAFDKSLTRTIPTALSVARESLAATTVGGYALFAGGFATSAGNKSTVDAYDESLTRTNPAELSVARSFLAATAVGGYALFGGGNVGHSTQYKTVDAYSTSLTRTTPTTLSVGRSSLAATEIGGYALFGGGEVGLSGCATTVDAYDTSLTRTVLTGLSIAKCSFTATTIEDYALFGGGSDNDYNDSTVVDAFDKSLTRTNPAGLSVGRCNLAATTVGSYALFGGGEGNNGSAIVDAYTI